MPFKPSPFDGAQLHYTDYRPTSRFLSFQPTSENEKDFCNTNNPITIVFIHGWPMSSQMYEHLMLPLCETYGIRCIATDRRGFGKSEWTGEQSPKGDISLDVFAKDTIHILKDLNPHKFIFVASSMGCGETLLAYLQMDEDLKKNCQGFIWLGPSLPYPLKSDFNPDAPPRELWDSILQGFRNDRVGFVKQAIPGVFGTTFGIGVQVAETILQKFEAIVAQADALAIERCVMMITARDFRGDLEKFGSENEEIKVLVCHGDHDQGMPASASADWVPKYVKQAQVKIYKNAAHGLYVTHAKEVMEDILTFVSGI